MKHVTVGECLPYVEAFNSDRTYRTYVTEIVCVIGPGVPHTALKHSAIPPKQIWCRAGQEMHLPHMH